MYKSHSDIKELFDRKYVHISLVAIANRNLGTGNFNNKRPTFPEPLFLERYYKKGDHSQKHPKRKGLSRLDSINTTWILPVFP